LIAMGRSLEPSQRRRVDASKVRLRFGLLSGESSFIDRVHGDARGHLQGEAVRFRHAVTRSYGWSSAREWLHRIGSWIYASDRSRYQASNIRRAFYPEDKPSHYDVFYGNLPTWMWLKEIGGRNPRGRASQHQKSIPANGLADHGMAWSRDKEFAHVIGIDCLYQRLLFLGHRCLPLQIRNFIRSEGLT
jgi:hypothetical protein